MPANGTKGMRVVIAGSRGFKDDALLRHVMDDLSLSVSIVEVVSGAARGADKLGEEWAFNRGITVKRFHPEWDKEGKRAGILRNIDMAEYADMAVVFWDGSSRGSKDMIGRMNERGKRVEVIQYDAKKR